jgi:glycosyltransferase involved in cell wall biosynthesis
MVTSARARGNASNPPPIRVLHVLASLRTGGTEQGVINLINSLDPARVQAGICVFDSSGAEELLPRLTAPDVYFRTATKRFGNDPATGLRLAKIIDDGKFDVVHSHGWPTYLETWLALKLRPRIPAVHGEHGTSFLERRRRRWAFGILAKRWQRFLFVSKGLRELFRRETRIPSERMVVIPNGVDFGRFAPITESERSGDSCFEASWFHIGTAGRLHEVKNHWLLLRVAERAKAAGNRRVRDMSSFYHALDLFVLTSRSEGHPNALLEGLASGLPVISTPVGDVPEFLSDGVNGWLVPQDDDAGLLARIERCAVDEQLRREVASRGQRDIREGFSMEAMTRAYTELYEQLPLFRQP